MEAQLIRYRANRKHVFGVLNLGDLECFVMELRNDRIDAGSYEVSIADYDNVVRVGDNVVTHDRFVSRESLWSVGASIKKDKLEERIRTGEMLVTEILKGVREGALNLEIIDEADYDEADSDLA